MQKNSKKAFTLIELAMVILIISILISGGLSVSLTAINNAKIKITNERIAQIYNALGNHLLSTGRLPCPASILEIKSSSSTYGDEVTCSSSSGGGVYVSTISTTLNYGMVPVTALGLPKDMAEDGFGNKLVYVVDRTFADTAGYSYSSYPPIVVTENQGSSDQNITTNTDGAVFVIMSYGSNQSGAFPSNSATQNAASADSKELSNALTSSDFYIDSKFYSEAKSSDVFDDIVFYKKRNNLLLDFDALSLIKCPLSTTLSSGTNYTNATDVGNCASGTCVWPESYYNQVAVSTSACSSSYASTVSSPTKRCGAFGIWQVGAINACTN
jgi:prepilin-type N-terminal cleavage/methylation domain-containing protein